MRGLDKFNFPAFWEAAYTLRALGHEVGSPAEFDIDLGYAYVMLDGNRVIDPHLLDSWDIERAEVIDTEQGVITKMLQYDYQWITNADAIALLPGWEKSTGARGETRVALETGRTIYLYKPDPHLEGIDEPLVEADLDYVRRVIYNEPTPEQRADNGQRQQGDDEVRVTDPNTGGQKGSKSVQFGRLPRSLAEVARHFTIGSNKYPDVEPGRANWSLGYAYSLGFNAMMRHAFDWWYGENTDAETGSNHLAAVVFHALTLMEFQNEGLGTDDRPVHTADRRDDGTSSK